MKRTRVALIYPSRDNATMYYRLVLPSRYFVRYIPVVYRIPSDTSVTVEQFVERIKEDLIILHRASESVMMIAIYANSIGKKVIFDTDDLEYNLPKNHHLIGLYPPHVMKERFRLIAKHSDEIWVTTEELKRDFSHYTTTPIYVIPNAIDPFEPQWSQRRNPHNSFFTIGWVGGVSHLPDLPFCTEGIKKLIEETDNVRVVLCGVPPADDQYKLIEVRGKVVKMNLPKEEKYETKLRELFSFLSPDQLILENSLPLSEYANFYRNMDVVIAPLAPNRFNNCKSELKILEAGMWRLPIIVSPTRTYTRFHRNYPDTIFVAYTKSDWYKYLKKLNDSPSLRRARGARLYEVIVNNYNLTKWARYREDRIKYVLT